MHGAATSAGNPTGWLEGAFTRIERVLIAVAGAAILVSGGITGALAGVGLSFYPQLGDSIGLGGILILAVVFAMIGSWVSGMIAVSIPNSRLRRFQPAIDRGQILLMVDVPVRRVGEIRDLIMSHHPEAQAKGQEAQIPAFP